ncbi:MAG: PASTA domain-containing protein [Planctomycetota bacterium]
MKKIAVFVAILALVTPSMAAVTITTTTNSADCTITIGYTTDANLSGFALDCNVSDGNTIDAITDFHVGESNSSGTGFGIFPGSIDVNSVSGQVDDFGNPVAPNSDPGALAGLGNSGVTIELGALYEDGNQPASAGTLCTLEVSGACLMKIALNTTRGGIVKEDSNDATVANLPLNVAVPCVSLCTTPNVVGMTVAAANDAIVAAGLELGTVDWGVSWVYDVNIVMDQDPNAGTQVSCNPTAVNLIKSGGCFPRPDPNYSQWAQVGRPNCWCLPRQCYGDTDNQTGGTKKGGYFYVGAVDLAVLSDNWGILEPPKGSGIIYLGEPNICADFAHDAGGTKKGGYFRVGATDLALLSDNWGILEPPKGSGIPGDCP